MTVRKRPGYVCVWGGGGGKVRKRCVRVLGVCVWEGGGGRKMTVRKRPGFVSGENMPPLARRIWLFLSWPSHRHLKEVEWSLYLLNEVQTLDLPTTIDMWPNPRLKVQCAPPLKDKETTQSCRVSLYKIFQPLRVLKRTNGMASKRTCYRTGRTEAYALEKWKRLLSTRNEGH